MKDGYQTRVGVREEEGVCDVLSMFNNRYTCTCIVPYMINFPNTVARVDHITEFYFNGAPLMLCTFHTSSLLHVCRQFAYY